MNEKEFYLSKPWLKHYPEGALGKVDIPEGVSVPDMIDQAVAKYSKQPALIFYGREISYAKLKELIDRFATEIADLGLKM